jgi:uncharacterized oxidoreductase
LPGIQTIVADVSENTARKNLISRVTAEYPSFNVLINNAGIQQILKLNGSIAPGAIDSEIAVNFGAVIHLTDLVVPHFLHKNEAAIINISSGLGFIPVAIMPVYCATKAAIHSFCITSRH